MTTSTPLSTPIDPPVLNERCIKPLSPQVPVIAVDTFGASPPGAVVMEHHEFAVDNICGRAGHLLPKTQRRS